VDCSNQEVNRIGWTTISDVVVSVEKTNDFETQIFPYSLAQES